MLIKKKDIEEAKELMGDKAAELIAKDLSIKEWDEINLKGLCCWHHEITPSLVWSSELHLLKCFGCGRHYNIIDHYMSFYKLSFLEAVKRLFDETGIKYSFGEKNVKQKDYRYPYYDKSEDRSKVEEYLGLRGISKETLDYCDVQQDGKGNIVFNFYDSNDVLTLVKYRPARKIKDGENKTWCQKDADTKNILFNMNRIDPSKPLALTEGEGDCLSLIEAGYKNAVSVPLGAGNMQWIEENFDWLEQFDKIIIWADNDGPGNKLRKEAVSRLGTWRTYYVDLPTEVETSAGKKVKVKDANEVLFHLGKQAVLDFINDAKEMPIIGISDLAEIDEFDIETAGGLYSNLKPLDELIYKFLFGSVVLITGRTGAGKSTFINQVFICEPLDQGQDVFIYSGELSAPVVKYWFELSLAGPNHVIKGMTNNKSVYKVKPEIKQNLRDWYKSRVWLYTDEKNDVDIVLDRAINTTRKYGSKVWLLDNLMTLDLGAGTDKLEKQKNFIVKLNKLAIQYDVLVVLVAHPRKEMYGVELNTDSVSGAAEIGNTVQYMLSARRYTDKEKAGEMDKNGNYKKGKEPIPYDVEISVLKNRYTGNTGRLQMYYEYKSRRFHSKAPELFRKYGWDKSDTLIPKDYPKEYRPANDADFMYDE